MSKSEGIKNSDRFLLIGSSGMLGRAWLDLLEKKQCHFDTLDYPTLNIADHASVNALIDKTYHYIINCAAYTEVDQAENNQASAHAINANGVKYLADLCQRKKICLIHYSTDYVFNGNADQPYAIDEPLKPINAYGQSKADGEAALLTSGCDHLLIRTSWLYAPWGKNFVRTIRHHAKSKEQLKVVSDQVGRPTSARLLAENSYRLLESGSRGTFHLTDQGQCTWAAFADAIIRHTALKCEIKPCSTADYPTTAKRPAYSVLDLEKSIETIGNWPNWQEALESVMKEIEGIHE